MPSLGRGGQRDVHPPKKGYQPMNDHSFDPTDSRLAETYPGSWEELLAEHGDDWGLYELMERARTR